MDIRNRARQQAEQVPSYHTDSSAWGWLGAWLRPYSNIKTLRLLRLRTAGAFGLSPCASAAHGNRGRSSGGPETAIWAAPCEAHFFDRTSLKPRGAAIIAIRSPRERFTVHLRNQSDRSEHTPPSASCYELTTRAVSRAPEGQYPLNQTLPGQGSLTTEE